MLLRAAAGLTEVGHHEVYMVYCSEPHYGVQVAGQRLTTWQQRTVTLKQGWNSLPYLQMSPSRLPSTRGDRQRGALSELP